MARKTSADWRQELADVTDTMQAMIDIAKEEERDLSAEEAEDFQAHEAKLKEIKAGLESAEKFEATKRELAELRSLQSQPTAPLGGLGVRGAAERANVQHRLGPIRSFGGQSAARDAFDCGMWLRAAVARMRNTHDEEAETRISTRGWDVRNVATEGSPGGGGYLVPVPMSNAIIDVRALAGVSRQIARVVPMTSETLTIPKKLTGTTVYYPGEAGATTPSDQSWGQIQLTVKKRAILSLISQELRDDSLIAIVDDLVSQMGLDFAVKEDAELVNGDGTSTYGLERGLLNMLGAGGVYAPANSLGKSVWSGLTMTDFTNAMAKLPSRYQSRGTAWLVSSEFYYGVMLSALAAAGGNTIAILEGGAADTPMFMGKRVWLTDQMPRTTATSQVSALYGSFSDAVMIGDRGGVSIKQSDQFKLDEDVLAILATTRYDINAHDTGDANAAGAVVGLSTAAS